MAVRYLATASRADNAAFEAMAKYENLDDIDVIDEINLRPSRDTRLVCPDCGSRDVGMDTIRSNNDGHYDVVFRCSDCMWIADVF